MSDTRIFDYNEISNIYKSMNEIIGDNSNPTSIAGLLYKIDQNYREVVNGTAGEDLLALYGGLGSQMLLNWENTSATFPLFIRLCRDLSKKKRLNCVHYPNDIVH